MKETKIDELIESFTEKKKEFTELKKKYRNELLNYLYKIAKPAFENSPSLECICWTQYTPYFNDGDVCKFGVGSQVIKCTSVTELKASLKPESMLHWDKTGYTNDELLEGYDNGGWPLRHFLPSSFLYKNLSPIFKILSSLDNDDYLELWGDHSMVTITANGINSKEYDHE